MQCIPTSDASMCVMRHTVPDAGRDAYPLLATSGAIFVWVAGSAVWCHWICADSFHSHICSGRQASQWQQGRQEPGIRASGFCWCQLLFSSGYPVHLPLVRVICVNKYLHNGAENKHIPGEADMKPWVRTSYHIPIEVVGETKWRSIVCI